MVSTGEIASVEASVSDGGYRGRFVRDLFTGELKEVPSDGGGRRVIYREPVDPILAQIVSGRANDPWSGPDHISRPLSLKPEDATPERIERENAEARRHGTGAYFTPDGLCHTPTRGSRSREMRRPRDNNTAGYMDLDAGFGDWAGR